MKRFTLFHLLPGELAVIVQRILKFIVVLVPGDPAIANAYGVVIKNLGVLKKALSKDKKSQYTIQLLEKDRARDNAFISFRDSINVLLRNPDPTIREKAKKLQAILKKYGYTLYKLPYAQQSDAMDRLIAELKQPLNFMVIEELGLKGLLETMDKAAISFEDLRQEKVDEETKVEYLKVYEAYRELSGDTKDLVKFLALLKKGNYKPELPEIISSIEKELTDIGAVAKGRKTRKEDSKPAA